MHSGTYMNVRSGVMKKNSTSVGIQISTAMPKVLIHE